MRAAGPIVAKGRMAAKFEAPTRWYLTEGHACGIPACDISEPSLPKQQVLQTNNFETYTRYVQQNLLERDQSCTVTTTHLTFSREVPPFTPEEK